MNTEAPILQEKEIESEPLSRTTYTRPALITEYIAPGSQMEKILSNIWKEHFILEKVGINDNFFDLGATSLDIIQISGKLKDKIGKDVPVATFFRYPNIRSLALHLSQGEKQKIIKKEEIKRSDKVLSKREKIQNRTKFRKSMR
jgi:acyl carrier protein